jgi:hypothetical protein
MPVGPRRPMPVDPIVPHLSEKGYIIHFDACLTATDKPCPAPIIPILLWDETICASPDLRLPICEQPLL